GDDAVELGQRLDLIDDDAAHLRRALGGLLRQFEHAAAQLGAGRFELALHVLTRGFEFALHLGRHLLHAAQRLREARIGLLEQRMGVAGGLVEDVAHRRGGAPALGVGLFAHALELLADRAGALGAGLLHGAGDVVALLADALVLLGDGARALGGRLGDDAGDVAGAAGGGIERLVDEAGEALEPLGDLVGADVERGYEGIELNAALVDALLGRAVAALDELGRLGELLAVHVEGPSELAEIGEHLARDLAEAADVRLHAAGRFAGGQRDVVHGADEFGHAQHQRVFQRAHVLVRAGEHLL